MTTSASPASDLPLAGVRILDLSAVIFGPLATQTLADYGADVIKIEPPEGDSTRFTGPDKERGMSTVFLGANRNKRALQRFHTVIFLDKCEKSMEGESGVLV